MTQSGGCVKKEAEGIKHWLSSCEYLASREFLKRHDQVLRVFYAEVLKSFSLVDDKVAWFNIPVQRVMENDKCIVVWNKKIPTHHKIEHRWPDLRVEDKDMKVIYIIDMACPSDGTCREKEIQKRLNYNELVYELRTQRPGWQIEVLPLIVGVTGGIHLLKVEVAKLIRNEKKAQKVVDEMQKTAVLGSLQIIHRIECHLV